MNTAFFDIDTQIDFVFPAGALYVPGAELVLPQVSRLNRHAKQAGIPLISTADAHAENDPEFELWPPHCVAGTLGQRKPDCTLTGQIVLNKQSVDCFTIPGLPDLLAQLRVEHAVVYGVVTEICVKHAVFGLLDRGIRVTLVEDAVRALDGAQAAAMIREMQARGGSVARTAEIAAA
ncbi:MAG: cysteine hydrolase [Bryobacteraceae bacterium]|nr:cysteine hydrolase [Bryobacteraceae bacterium]